MSVLKISLDEVSCFESQKTEFSPVIWDGYDLVLADSALNLSRIRSDINNLLSKMYGLNVESLDQDLDRASNSLAKTETVYSFLEEKVSDVEEKHRNVPWRIDALNSRVSTIESSAIAQDASINDLSKIVDLIKSGNLIVSDDVDIIVSKNGLCDYYIFDQTISNLTLFPGNNLNIDYNYQSGQYTLSGELPSLTNFLRSGKGIEVTEQSGKIIIKLKKDLITSLGGLVTQNNLDGTYSIYPAPDFITGDGSLDIRNVDGQYIIGLKQEIVSNLSKGYYTSGFGIIIQKQTISIDPAWIPSVASGKGVTVTKLISDKSSTYTLTYDKSTAEFRPQPSVAANSPITLNSLELDAASNAKSYTIGLDSSFKNNIDSTVATLNSTIETLQKALHSLGWNNISQGMKMALACPILKIFRLATNTSSVVNIGESGGSSPLLTLDDSIYYDNSLALIQKYGVGTKEITVHHQVTPTLTFDPQDLGSNNHEFGLYLPLQEHLRKTLNNPNFTIKEKEKGTTFKLVSVGNNNLLGYVSPESTHLKNELCYNYEISIRNLVLWLNVYYEGCDKDAYPSDESFYRSSTFSGSYLSVTGGDVDYLCGKNRAGQKNEKPLFFPESGFTYEEMIKIVNTVKEELDEHWLRYVLDIEDGYSGSKTYRVSFKKKKQISFEEDYIEEESFEDGTPDWVRAYARLYTNWELNDTDTNKMLWLLGKDDRCLADKGGEFFYGAILAGDLSNLPESFQTETNLAQLGEISSSNQNLNLDDETINLSLDLPNNNTVSLDTLSPVSIPITYELNTNVSDVFSDSELFSDCCWGSFDKMRSLTCGADDQVV